ncbi:MAG: RNA polymerase sigma factor SigR [Candidatus Sumerlaeia bacterium]
MPPHPCERLVEDCLNPLFAYAMRLTRHPDQAEDLVQEAFARFFAHADRYDVAREGRLILFRTLRNVFIDQVRAERRRPALISVEEFGGNWDAVPLTSGHSPHPLDEILRHVLSEEVEAALNELDETFREAIWLREIEGFSYQEISQITGAPIGTVRSRLARARAMLAHRLEDVARRRGLLQDKKGKQVLEDTNA